MSSLAVTDEVLTEFATQVGDTEPIAVEGHRTRWSAGGDPIGSPRLISAPSGIVAYEPAEMTVTVRAGTPVAELEDVLADARQRSALPARGGTVGGAVMVGENSLHVLGRGRLRDRVLQIRYVAADGSLVTGGGPTVKNVSGYNLPKLFVGSLGTLGLIAEVIIRTNPVPAMTQWVVAADADPVVVQALVRAPSAILWDGSSVWVELEGHQPDVEADLRALRAVGRFEETDGPPHLPPHRWSCTPAETRNAPDQHVRFVAEIGVGIIHSAAARPERRLEPGVAALAERIRHQFDPAGRLNPGRRPGVSS